MPWRRLFSSAWVRVLVARTAGTDGGLWMPKCIGYSRNGCCGSRRGLNTGIAGVRPCQRQRPSQYDQFATEQRRAAESITEKGGAEADAEQYLADRPLTPSRRYNQAPTA